MKLVVLMVIIALIGGCGKGNSFPSPPTATSAPTSPSGSAPTSADEAALAVQQLMSAEKFTQAATVATEGLKLDPKNYSLLTDRARSYQKLQRHQEASLDYTAALEVAPQAAKWTLLAQRAFCARELGLADSAEKDFAAAAEIMDDDPDPNFAHEMWLVRGDNLAGDLRYQESIPCFTEALKYRLDPAALAGRAFSYGVLKDSKNFETDMAALVQLNPEMAKRVREAVNDDAEPTS